MLHVGSRRSARVCAGCWFAGFLFVVVFVLVFVLVGAVGPRAWAEPAAGPEAPAARVSLDELLAHAEQHAPVLRIATRRSEYAAAARAEARPLFRDNPVVELGLGPRWEGSRRVGLDLTAAIAQPIDVSGARGLAREAADRLGDQLAAEAGALRWQLHRDIHLAYREARLAQEQLALAERVVVSADEILAMAQRRLAAGAIGAIDARLAESEAARAHQGRIAAAQVLRAAQLRLCELTGWPVARPPVPGGALEAPLALPQAAELLDLARARHPEVRARRAAVAEARARVALADREAWPDPSIGISAGREAAAEASGDSAAGYVILGTLELPLPLWQRGQGARARARTDVAVAGAELEAVRAAMEAQIQRALSAAQAAAERIQVLGQGTVPALEDTLTMLGRAFAAGEIGALELAMARERLLQAQREVLSAYAEYYQALAELEGIVGAEISAAGTAHAGEGAP